MTTKDMPFSEQALLICGSLQEPHGTLCSKPKESPLHEADQNPDITCTNNTVLDNNLHEA